MKYTLEISENQAKVIMSALEEYFRLRMNQTIDFANSICFESYDYKNHTEEDFNERIERRDLFDKELKQLLQTVHPLVYKNGYRKQTNEMLIAQDIWQVIRHQLFLDRGGEKIDWCTAAREPMQMSGEELPTICRDIGVTDKNENKI